MALHPEEESQAEACDYVKIAEGAIKSPLVTARVRVYLQRDGIDLIVFHPAMDADAFELGGKNAMKQLYAAGKVPYQGD